MKTKLVLWGTKGSDETTERVLIALELKADDNLIQALVFSGEEANEELRKELHEKWRKNVAVQLPEQVEKTEYPLIASSGILPPGITVDEKERELVERNNTKWMFIVLSTKLFRSYETELNALQDKVDDLSKYDKKLWSEMKLFWEKVQNQFQEKNLFHEHHRTLKEHTNEIFAQLKALRAKEDEAFEAEAKINFEAIDKELNEIQALLEGEAEVDFFKTFERLKSVQTNFHKVKLTKSWRNQLWNRLDQYFKALKEKRSGGNIGQETRVERRLEGLKKAIVKMQESIARDQKELDLQVRKSQSTKINIIETQLREVKAKLVRERIDSKNNKLADMQKTERELETRLSKIKAAIQKESAKNATKAEENNDTPPAE